MYACCFFNLFLIFLKQFCNITVLIYIKTDQTAVFSLPSITAMLIVNKAGHLGIGPLLFQPGVFGRRAFAF